MRIAYFVNQYPKVSHTFIRREIAALERQGVVVERYALRGWDAELADADDRAELARTRHVLRGGLARLLAEALPALLRHPARSFAALRLALALARRSDRRWPYHLVYLAEASRLARWLEQSGAQHVHAHFGTNSAEVVLLAHALGGPAFSFTVHGPEEFDQPEALHLGDKVLASAFTVAISAFGRSQLWRWIPAAQWSRVQVVHCGLEPAFFVAAGEVRASTQRRLVCVGRLCEQKGQLLLLEAAHRLAERGIDFELVLAGDGEMRSEVEGLIAKYALAEKVRITGWISGVQVRAEILAARALVLPSFAEGLPVVIMEAMALRRPVLTTYVAGIPELVRPGENGWLFPAGSVEDLVTAMSDLLSQPVEVLERMGEAAHARVLSRHDIDTGAARLAALFRQSRP